MIKKLLVIFVICLNASNLEAQTCVAITPSKLKLTGITSCTATLSWNSVPGIFTYQVKYRIGNGTWSTIINTGTDTFRVFTNLLAATSYQFEVRSKCADGSKSPFKKKKGTTSGCTLPVVTGSTVVSPSSVQIMLTALCPFDSIRIRYKYNGGMWSYYTTTDVNNIKLTDLLANTTYTYEATTCLLSENNWTGDNFFTTPASFFKPNIVLFVLDDARFDTYGANFGPSFFNCPNINRVANEGVNFQYHFATTSYCTPSRASMVTGLYCHKHGAIANGMVPDPAIPTVATILHDNGYDNGLVGKFYTGPKLDGYNYWLSLNPCYIDCRYTNSYRPLSIKGHSSDVITDSALKFISNAQSPFYIWLGYYAPHDVKIPQTQYSTLYLNDAMPIPENDYPYADDYPSNIYLNNDYMIEPDSIDYQYTLYFQMIKGIDDALGKIFSVLESKGILDSTMIIFTSDNGRLYGEHLLYSKRYAYDPSMRIPLFIRYPAWFTAGTVVKDDITTNLDLTPTMLHAAGIDALAYNMDGLSLKDIYDGSQSRKEFYYEYVRSDNIFPTMLSVRSFDYKYIQSICPTTTEEFFDLHADSMENTNLINNPGYASLVDMYRFKLDSFETVYEYESDVNTMPCYLVNNYRQSPLDDGGDPDFAPLISPNPSSGKMVLNNPFDEDATVIITGELGQVFLHKHLVAGANELDLHTLKTGIYYLRITSTSGQQQEQPVLIIQ